MKHRNLVPPAALMLWLIACVFAVGQVNISTFGGDNSHTCLNSREITLTPANVKAQGGFGQLFVQTLDGQSYGQPLYMSNVKLADGTTHNVVFIATEHDSLYAFDADSNTGSNAAPLWYVNLVPPGSTTVPAPETLSTDMSGEVGITATPVIDPSTNTIYAVTLVKSSSGGVTTYAQYLNAVDISTHQLKFGSPVLINPTFAGTSSDSKNGVIPFNPLRQNSRASLTLYNGILYVAFASHGDNKPYHGLILGYDSQKLQLVKSFITTPNEMEGGIWCSGAGPVVDSDGNLYITTGNADKNQNFSPVSPFNWSEAFLKFPTTGNFEVSDYFSPYNQLSLTNRDSDLGASGILLLPDQAPPHQHLMISGGKGSVLYVVDRDNLGQYNTTSNKIVQQISDPAPLFCSFSYFNNTIYYAPDSRSLIARSVGYNSATGTYISPSISQQSAETFPQHGSTAFISANGNQNGIVWISNHGNPSILYAYDANNISKSIYSFMAQQTVNGNLIQEQSNKFTLPTVANGKVYFVASQPASGTRTVGHLFVLGLLNQSAQKPSTPENVVATPNSSNAITVSWTAPNSSATSFIVSRSASPSGPFQAIATVSSDIFQAYNSGLTPKSTYYYQVVAANNAGSSAPSATVNATTFDLYNPPGLVGYWNLDEGTGSTVHDVTGNGHDGIISGEVEWAPGLIGQNCLQFHGAGVAINNVIIPNSFPLQFYINQSFTLSAWVMPGLNNSNEGIICKSFDQGNRYGIGLNSSNNWVFFGPTSGTTTSSNFSSTHDLVGPTATGNTWTHVTVVQDGVAEKRYLYINGVLAKTGPAYAADGGGNLWFGEGNGGSGPPVGNFPGYLDDVRLYNRALEPSEITSLLGPPVLQAVSNQSQKSSVPYSLLIPTSNEPAVESRQGSPVGSYSLELSFGGTVSGLSAGLQLQPGVAGTPVGTVSSIQYDSNRQVATINLANVANDQRLVLHVTGTQPSSLTGFPVQGTVDIPLDVLWGDVNGDGVVTSADVSLIQNNFASSLDPSNALYDINCDGAVNSTDSSLANSFLGKTLGLVPIFEAENLSFTATTGVKTEIDDDPHASNGQTVKLDATAVGQYIEFTLPAIPAGTYELKINYKGFPSRSIVQVSVNGSDLGSPIDEYNPNSVFHQIADVGQLVLPNSGDVKVRMTIIGKNAKSSGYSVMTDQIELLQKD